MEELLIACSCKNYYQAIELLNEGANPNTEKFYWKDKSPEFEGYTPLHYACKDGELDFVKSLIEKFGASPNVTSKMTVVFITAAGNTISRTRHQQLQRDGYRMAPKEVVLESITPLHVACANGHAKIVHYLMTECNIYHSNEPYTPLHLACKHGQLDIVKLLLTTHWDTYKRLFTNSLSTNVDGFTALHLACLHNQPDIVSFLVTNVRLDPNVPDVEKLNTPLHSSCELGYLDIVETLVNVAKCKLNLTNEYRQTALHIACLNYHSDIVKFLTSNPKCNPNVADSEGNTPLHVSCERGHLDEVKFLTEVKKCEANLRNNDGFTALHLACLKKQCDIVTFLASNTKCNPNLYDDTGNTPLHSSCEIGYVDIVKALVTMAQCEPNLMNINNETALHIASRKGDLEIVDTLITNPNCNPDQTNQDGCTALHLACKYRHFGVANLLIAKANCNPNLLDGIGNSPLHISCAKGDFNIIVVLITVAKCKPDFPNISGDSAVHIGCRNGHMNVVDFLITDVKCKPDLLNINGETALHIACKQGQLNFVRLLIEKGKFNPHLANEAGNTPLHFACEKGHLDTVTQLAIDHQCNPEQMNGNGESSLHIACKNGHLNIVDFLVTMAKCNPNLPDKDGNTPLHIACENGHFLVANSLVTKAKCDVNLANYSDGNTPLHLACIKGNVQLVELLVIDVKCTTNLFNNYGNTPLHLACTNIQNTDIVNVLISHGESNPNFTNNDGNTALHFACDCNAFKSVKVLITNTKARINTNLKNKDGNTPLHLACYHEFFQSVNILLKDVKCDLNIENNAGYMPGDLTSNSEIVRELIRHGANMADVYKTYGKNKGMKQPIQTLTKVFVVGNPSAGKSTLTAAIQKETSFLQRALASKKVSKVDEKTAGVIPYDFESKICGHITLYDFAGHREFYSSHAALLQNSVESLPPIFLLVIDVSKSDEEIRHTVLYWLSFLKSQCTSVNSKPHIIVVGSHVDILKSQGEDPIKKVEIIHPLLTSPHFHFSGLVTMDCQFYQSKGMTELRQCIRKSCDALRTQNNPISFGTHCFFVYLIDNFKDSVALQLHQIQGTIAKSHSLESKDETLNFLPNSLERLRSICKELNDTGHVLYLEDPICKENSWIIVDKMTLLSDVTGTIFAPKDFKEHCQLSNSTGVVPLSNISDQFPNYDSGMLIGFLSHMEFCQEIHDQEILKMIGNSSTQSPPLKEEDTNAKVSRSNRHFMFPGLISLNAPSHVWKQKCNHKFHFGWILQCSRMEDFFTTQFLHILLLRLAFSYAFPHKNESTSGADNPAIQRRCSIWKNGIYWGNRDGVETLVEVLDHNKTVTVLMRSEEITPASLLLRSKVIQKVLEAAQKLCSNVVTVESVIDLYEVVQHPMIPTSQLDLFSLKEVAESVVCGKPSTLSKNGHPSSISSLLSFEPYANLRGLVLHELFDEERSQKKMDDRFISQIAKDLLKPKEIMFEYFEQSVASNSHQLQENTDFEDSALYAWKDSCEGTYQCLRDKLNEISVFAGRNPFEIAGIPIRPPALNGSTQEDETEEQGELSITDLRRVKNDVWDTRLQWYNIGVQLNMSVSSLDVLQEENRGNIDKCFTEMLKQWLKTKPQWSDLVEALKSPAVNERVLADKIHKEHITAPLPSFQIIDDEN